MQIYKSRIFQLIILLFIVYEVCFSVYSISNLQQLQAPAAMTSSRITSDHPSQLHLFGLYVASLDDLPTTTLPLLLEGTEINIGGPSSALISVNNQKPKSFSPADEIMPGVSIHKILPNEVVLDDHAVLYKLPLPVPNLSQ